MPAQITETAGRRFHAPGPARKGVSPMHREPTTAVFGDPRLPERFWAKVEVRDDGCWHWTAALKFGYGEFASPKGESKRAHRYAYAVLVSDPGELQLDHLCRVRHCVNPAHLEPVTNRENCLRGEGFAARNARKTHCIHGHELSGENVYISPRNPNGRECRACHKRWEAEYEERNRETRRLRVR